MINMISCQTDAAATRQAKQAHEQGHLMAVQVHTDGGGLVSFLWRVIYLVVDRCGVCT